MPVKIERALKKSASEHGFKKGSERYGAYVYGSLNKIEKGKVGHKRKKKGVERGTSYRRP